MCAVIVGLTGKTNIKSWNGIKEWVVCSISIPVRVGENREEWRTLITYASIVTPRQPGTEVTGLVSA